MLESVPVLDLLEIAVAAFGEHVAAESIEKLRRAAREFAQAEAAARRKMSCEIILQIARMDAAQQRLQREYTRFAKDLGSEAREAFQRFLDGIQENIDTLRREKRRIDRGHACR